MTARTLTVNHIIVPARPYTAHDAWIDYLRETVANCTRADIDDAYDNNSAYPIDDYAGGGTDAVRALVQQYIDSLAADHSHIDVLHPYGLTLDGGPAAMLVAETELVFPADSATASREAVGFALTAWLVNEHQCRQRRERITAGYRRASA